MKHIKYFEDNIQMIQIKTYESFGRDISQFIDMVISEYSNKIYNVYDLFQEYEDDGSSILVGLSLKGPSYEEDYNIDLINLFYFRRNGILVDIGEGELKGGEIIDANYERWINENDHELLLDYICFSLLFEGLNVRNYVDSFLVKLNSMFNYSCIKYDVYSKSGIKIDCEL